MLELKNVTKNYNIADSSVQVLKGINLVFRKSEFVSILGQSGCGKTTLLNIVGGLDHLTTGDLIINGKSTKDYNSRDWDTYRNHTIGFVFQSYNLIPHQTVLQNVELALSIGGVSKKERKERATEALKKVGLAEHLHKKPNQLSGGQCQRVSIARALVNNPDIILADEPTGALDSETSVQVMELLKEISQERLVIMVTHNPELADKYSTRIVRMLDGVIQEDTNPVSEKEYKQILKDLKESEAKIDINEKKQKEKKSAMSYWTSMNLSLKNLLTKKRRTFITALACSIGIIGIAVILSVSAGMQNYVNTVQMDSASVNYINISANQADPISMMQQMSGSSNLPEYPDNTTGITPYEQNLNFYKKQIISQEYLDYIDDNLDKEHLIGIQYSRDTDINVITKNNDTYSIVDTSGWTEILNNPSYIAPQYTVLYKGADNKSFPTEYNEVALVVDKYNRLSTTMLTNLGISFDSNLTEIPYEQIIDKEFKLVLNNNFYTSSTQDTRIVYSKPNTQNAMQTSYNNGISLKVVCILRQNENANGSWISTGIGYTSALTDYVLEQNANSQIVQDQNANPTYNIFTGADFPTISSSPFGTSASLQDNLVSLGAITIPAGIQIYPKDFDTKDEIVEILNNWNTSEIYKVFGNEKDAQGNYIAEQYKVEYTDVSKLLSSMLNDTIDIITYALIAFSAISLVVSSIMIAIITYASVIERIKEIGVLRSLGARKKDISRVFIAEATIIGAVSAIIALIITLILNLIINLVLGSLVGISTIANLEFTTALGMILLCVGLNLIAGLIPANIASKKDPVVALRSE